MYQFDLFAGESTPAEAAPPKSRPNNLHEVAFRLAELPKSTRNAELRSAINTLCRVLGRQPTLTPVEPAELAKLLATAQPAVAGVNKQRWGRVCSLVSAALRACDFEIMPARDTRSLTATWRTLADALPYMKLVNGLSRLMHYFSGAGVEPETVTLADFDRFKVALETTSLFGNPSASYRTSVRLWIAAANSIASWPQILPALQKNPRSYSLPMSDFPQSFQDEVAAFLHNGSDPDELSEAYSKPLSSGTTDGRAKHLRQVASALVYAGYPLADITSLSMLVQPENAKMALRYLRGRNGNMKTHGVSHQVWVLCVVARHWVKDPVSDAALRKFYSALTIKTKGMVDRNRKKLRQFDLPQNVEALLNLPAKVFGEALRSRVGDHSEAVRVANALAVEILIVAPMRISNLAGLNLNEHLVRLGKSSESICRVEIPPDETKTHVPFDVQLPKGTVHLLDIFLKTYRPRLNPNPSPWLFSGRHGARRSEVAFSRTISEFLMREIGIDMHSHLFRHLAGRFYLEANPAGIETVRRLLGHTSTKTTMKAYCELDSVQAFRRYEDVIGTRGLTPHRGLPANQDDPQ
jgi:integrase